MADAGTALLRALTDCAGIRPEIMEAEMTRWSSVTFEGARHRLVIRLPGPAAGRLAKAVAGDAVTPVGHVLADIALVRRVEDAGERMEIEALTVEG
ncbi:hypothetical protein PQ455_10570 [Sphingomonas naphthae]|uniref:Uncharacterized protein n=1 Tax=Sphingomonas naphthae TaxID=1813468 RepID=A0ABY7TGM5_9SPHN|nr:hypothetical protein [Sphingomonas naphthae]WCT72090.1 hypothetical protein PQ455_10570 [Sphingomonas naphthae]